MSSIESKSETTSPAQDADAAFELEAILAEALHMCCGYDARAAGIKAHELVKVIRQNHPNTKIRIPTPCKQERNKLIRDQLRPGNAAEVAARHGLSVSAVYKIAGGRG